MSPRPRRCRRIGFMSDVVDFKPAGIKSSDLETIMLKHEELEAIRLKDILEMEQEACAQSMEISQPTFHRLLAEARKKIADCIVNGKSLRIEGGNFSYDKEADTARHRHRKKGEDHERHRCR